MFYIVEIKEGEDWIVFSKHRNQIYAEIQFDLLTKRQPVINVRIKYGKGILKEA